MLSKKLVQKGEIPRQLQIRKKKNNFTYLTCNRFNLSTKKVVYDFMNSKSKIPSSLLNKSYTDIQSMDQFEGIPKHLPCQGPILLACCHRCTFSNVLRSRNGLLSLAVNGNEDLIPVDPKNIFGQEPTVPANKKMKDLELEMFFFMWEL